MAPMPEAVHAEAVLTAARGAVAADDGVVLREAATAEKKTQREAAQLEPPSQAEVDAWCEH